MKVKNKPMGSKNPTIHSMLERLAQETILTEKVDLWPTVQANLTTSKTLLQTKEHSMNRRFIFSTLAAVLVLSVVVVVIANSVTTVSAKEILNRAYQAQSQQAPAEGISHIRSEVYSNLEALPEDQGMDTIVESYSDLQTGYFRLVTTDSKTGKVLDASAYDGTNTYSPDYKTEKTQNVTLAIYRTPQGQVALKPMVEDKQDEKTLFEKMRSDPHVTFVGKDTWDDGRHIYILRSQQRVKAIINGEPEMPDGSITIYFDANTYKQLGYRMSMEKDGQEILLASQKLLVDEILPEDTAVVWDLRDLQGITIIDDPNREHGDLLPEVISEQDLAAKTKNGYLLKTVPEGYTLEINAPPKQSANEPFIYIASYRTSANDYFVIQAGTEQPRKIYKDTDETYTTASGLVLHFMKDFSDSSDKQYTSAFVEAPGGVVFMINSTLPRETVKAWAEDLAPIK